MADNSDSDYEPGKNNNDDDEDDKSKDSLKSDKLSESSGNSPRKKIGTWKKSNSTSQFFHIYQCSFCKYETYLRYLLKKHFKCCKQSNTKNRLKCPRCAKIFTEIDLLNEHKLPVNIDDQRNHLFHCPVCMNDKEKKGQTPILKNYEIKSKPLVCTDCGTKIQGLNVFKRHMINTHSKTVQYRCEYCDYSSLEPSDLHKHKHSHSHQQEIGLIKCSHCTLDFFTMEDFKEHMKRIKKQNFNKDIKEINSDIVFPEERSTAIENCIALLNDLEDDVSDDENKDNEDDSKYEKNACRLLCSLCQDVHHSEESCYRHVKNKHRSEGYTAVTFDKYDGYVFRESIVIGKHEENLVTNIEDRNKMSKVQSKELENTCNSMDLLNALHLTPSVNTLENDKENNEVITIQLASDSEDGSILGDSDINDSFLEDEQIKQSKNDKITTDITVPESEKNVSDYNDKQLECTECSYKAKYNQHLLIHKQLAHEELVNGGFKCSYTYCPYTSYVKRNFRNHLIIFHKNKITMFDSEDLNCPDCNYRAKKPSHLIIHRKNKHNYRTLTSKIYKCPRCHFVTPHADQLLPHIQTCTKADTKCLISKSGRGNCPHCGLPINTRASLRTHLKKCQVKNNIPSTFSCRYCEKEHDKLYQLAWHIYMVHKDSTDIQKWLLKCEKCNFEHYSKVKCHEHGLQHKTSFLTFQKCYQGIPKGILRMRYLPRQFKDNLDDTINTEKDIPIEETNELDKNNVEQYTSKAAIDIMDWTHSDDDNLLKKKAEYFTCTKCSYETNCALHVPLHAALCHGDRIRSDDAKFKCPKCDFESRYRNNLKRHLIRSHKFDINILYTSKEESLMPSKKKTNYGNLECCQKHTNKYSMAWHVYKKHRDKTELHKWRIKCTLCNYKTYFKDLARQHAEAKHSGSEELVVVTFNTFYENELVGCFDFKIEKDSSNITSKENNSVVISEIPEIIKIEITSDGDDESNPNKNVFEIENQKSVPKFRKLNISNKNHKSSHNKYVLVNKKSSKKCKPAYVSKQNKLGNKNKVSHNDVCKNCNRAFEDKYELAIHLFKAHRDKTEIGKWAIKCMLCDFKSCWIKNASIHGRTTHASKNRSTTIVFQIFYETEFKKVFSFHYKSQPYSCNKCNFMTDTKKGMEKHKSMHTRELNVSRPIRNETAPIAKTNMKNLDSNDILPETSNAVKDFAGGHTDESNIFKIKKNQNSNNSLINIPVNNNEVITIEIVPDKADVSSEGERSIENIGLDPFTGGFVGAELINREKVEDNAFTLEAKPKIGEFRCTKVGCKYSCGSVEKITEHLKACTQNISLERNNIIKVTCNLCHNVIPNKRFMQIHCNKHAVSLNNPNLVASFSKFIGNRYSSDIEVIAKLDSNSENIDSSHLKPASKITYKCGLCGYLVLSRSTLRRHTQIHAREDGNPILKVKYSEYRDDEIGATVIMHADPDYVVYKRPARGKSPELEYDPNLDIFNCSECNFKTNEEDVLNKHENLHWTPKKEALFKAKKWFTCSECCFYCFDLAQFKKHGEWHKTHPKRTGNTGS